MSYLAALTEEWQMRYTKQNYVSDVEVGLPLHWWSGKTSKKQTHKSLNGLSIVVSGMAKKQQKTSQTTDIRTISQVTPNHRETIFVFFLF